MTASPTQKRIPLKLNRAVALTIAGVLVNISLIGLVASLQREGRDSAYPSSARALVVSSPRLSIAEQQYLVTRAIHSKTFQNLVAKRSYTIVGVQPWTTSEGVVLGADIEIALHRKSSVGGEWPTLVYDCHERGSRPYTTIHYHALMKGVSTLAILETHEKGEPVSVTTNESAIAEDIRALTNIKANQRYFLKCANGA
jgi:hypothetical protein